MKTPNRRDFIKTTAATAAALASGRLHPQPAAQTLTAPSADPLVLELANEALNVGAQRRRVVCGRADRTLPAPDTFRHASGRSARSPTTNRMASASARW